jgi:TfoX/Sxy family transcriptional regulator of competence genes
MTKPGTIDFILDQLISLDGVFARKMFGEYALYYDKKVVGLVCDNTLYIKITTAGKKFVGESYQEGCAYKGAKPSIKIDEDQIEDTEWLSKLVKITANSLPLPKHRK